MTIIIGALAMEMLGLLVLAGAGAIGLGAGPFAVPDNLAVPIAFTIGVVTTYALGRALGVIDFTQIDSYRERVDTMNQAARPSRRARLAGTPVRVRSVAIEY